MAIAIEQRRRQQIQQAAVRSSPCSIAHASPAGTLAVELAIQRSGARRTTAKRGGCAWARQRRGQGDETTARYHAGVHTRAQSRHRGRWPSSARTRWGWIFCTWFARGAVHCMTIYINSVFINQAPWYPGTFLTKSENCDRAGAFIYHTYKITPLPPVENFQSLAFLYYI